MKRLGAIRRQLAMVATLFFAVLAPAFSGDLRLAWDPPASNEDGSPVTDLAGYRIYYGESSGAYSQSLDVGTGNAALVSGLAGGRTYYFAVSAYNSLGVGSGFSEEFVWTAPGEAPASIEGRVQYAGRKAGAVTLMVYADPDFVSEPVRNVEVTAAGIYKVEDLAPGIYYLVAFMKTGRPLDPDFVSASAPWGVYGAWTNPAPVAVVAGQAVEVNISLADGGPANRNPFACADAPDDFDGDGRSDRAVYVSRTGLWTLRCTRDGVREVAFGYDGTQPVAGDFDNDGKDDIGVYDAAMGAWYLQRSAAGFSQVSFGFAGTVPVPADYDGDGAADLGVYDPASATWYVMRSTKGFMAVQFGYAGVLPVPADYDGDGRADIAVYDPRNGFWGRCLSLRGSTSTTFGFQGAVSATGDFDGDGAADLGVYCDSLGTWYDLQSRSGFRTTSFKAAGGARPVCDGR